MWINLKNTSARTDEKKLPSVFCFLAMLAFTAFLTGCSDFFEPVGSTPTPTEYSYNYWLLQRTYLFEDELTGLSEDGDSVQALYQELKDPFTRYIPPSKSEQTEIIINTSIVQGDVGMEYVLNNLVSHPLFINRVYPESPAGRAGVPRYGNIVSINGVELLGENAYRTYDSLLSTNKDIHLEIYYQGDTLLFDLQKEDVYAPTVFVDTTYGTIVVKISEFKQTTVNRNDGTLGELRSYLDSTRSVTGYRILDLRNNPGGHVNQCIAMADLFIKSGNISSRSWRTFLPDGKSVHKSKTIVATAGDAGEDSPFVLLINRASASCAEIFAAAISEGAGIPVVGENSYGKGIGQTTWHTMAGGMAIITNLEFLTPKGNSYHKKGIAPDYACDSSVDIVCAVKAIESISGKSTALKKFVYRENNGEVILRNRQLLGGALIHGDRENLN